MHQTTTTNPPAAELQGVSRCFGAGTTAVRALDGIDLAFDRGTFTAVMGPSGSGKSTLLNCLAGLDRPTAGRVLIEGTDITDEDEAARTTLRRARIGFVFQAFHLVPYLTVAQNVELPLRLDGRRPDRSRVAALLDRVGLADRAPDLPAVLSGGQQQRVAIARALVSDPAVVLADEPTGALDRATATGVLGLLRRCVDDLGQTVVMVTHDPEAAATADSALFLVDGRIVGRMAHPSVDAVAGQLAHLGDLVTPGGGSAAAVGDATTVGGGR